MRNSSWEKLYIQLVRQVIAHYRVVLLTNLLNSLILIYILRKEVVQARLFAWFMVLVVLVIARTIHARRSLSTIASYSDAVHNGRIYIVGLTLTGMTWGTVSLFLFPEHSLPHQLFISFVVGGMIVGASVTSAALDHAFLFFSVPALLPLILRFFSAGTEITNTMGLMLLIFLFSILIISRKIRFGILLTIESNLEKEKEIESRKKVEEELRKHQDNLENTITERTKELTLINGELVHQIQERKYTERKYQDIFHATNDALIILDASTRRISEVNQPMLDMYGYSLGEVSTFTFEDLGEGTSPYSRAEAIDHFSAAIRIGPQVFEWRAKGKRRQVFWVEVALQYSEFENGQYVIAVVRNIEARKKEEENLLKVKKLESVGLLAGGIAHDFNNILMAITGNINLALSSGNINFEVRKALEEAEKASVRARDLTLQLLTFSKGGEPIKKTSSLREIIKDSADLVLRGRKSSCSFAIPDDLYLVDIDKGQIGQVIQNIIVNADQAMPEGGLIRVTCENVIPQKGSESSGKTDRQVKVRFSDNGIGIPARNIDKIFDPFFSTREGGSGLGLAVCQSIINKHGGRISVDSVPGRGSTFTILLPASQQQDEINKSGGPHGFEGRHRILVMDDEEMVCNITRAMLLKMGLDVTLAKDGAEAIQLYKDSLEYDNPFDLVIMDLTIPGGMGGREAVGRLLDLDSKARVIVASGYSNDPVMARYSEFGFCGAIEKPYVYGELEHLIATLLA